METEIRVYSAVHNHRYGTTHYVFKMEVPKHFALDFFPSEEELIEKFDIDFEPDREESIEIDCHGTIDTLREIKYNAA